MQNRCESLEQPAENSLTAEECRLFRESGFLGPYTLCSADEMAGHRARIEREVLGSKPPTGQDRCLGRHVDCAVIHELCSHPAIVDRVRGLIGADVVLWNGSLWEKQAGAREIPWHQDYKYFTVDPPVTVSAWVAIDRATRENSCVQLIPGSHKHDIPHVKAGAEMDFDRMADASYVEESNAVDMELEPGQFFIFCDHLLHRSPKNTSSRRRLGMSARMAVPSVRIAHDEEPLFAGHKAILLAGEDRFGHLKLTQPPA